MKETLEEAAEEYSEKFHYAYGQQSIFYQIGFKEGANWQAERMYSEAIDLFITEIKNEFKDDNWDYLEFIKERVVEQFKK